MIAVDYIRSGELKHPEALRSFLHTVVRRLIAARILQSIRKRRRNVDMGDALPTLPARGNPESDLMKSEKDRMVECGLNTLQERDRELMTRFYINGQPFREICRDMNLTETQFRLYKNRAKAKLAEWGRHLH
jgi:RNA polymerase sigma factor (sigma-70 family)